MKKGINKTALGVSVIAALATVYFMQAQEKPLSKWTVSELQARMKSIQDSKENDLLEANMTDEDIEDREKYTQDLQAELDKRAGKSADAKTTPEEAAGGKDVAAENAAAAGKDDLDDIGNGMGKDVAAENAAAAGKDDLDDIGNGMGKDDLGDVSDKADKDLDGG